MNGGRALEAFVDALRAVSQRAGGEPFELGQVVCLAVVAGQTPDRAVEALDAAVGAWGHPPGSLLLASDLLDLGRMRAYGHRFEVLPPRAEWEAYTEGDYDAFLLGRISHMTAMYAARAVVGMAPWDRLAEPALIAGPGAWR